MREMGDRQDVFRRIVESLGCPDAADAAELLERFAPESLPRDPWVWCPTSGGGRG